MKKKIGYVLLILISIFGSRLIFGKDYHLNSSNLLDTNLYLYDIFNQKNVNLMLVDNENMYYLLNSGGTKNIQYTLVKYNLISNKIINEYHFTSNNLLQDIKLFNNKDSLYLTAINSNIYYIFNKNLGLLDQKTINSKYDTYALLNNNFITTNDNQVFKNDNLHTTLPSSCGDNTQVIYNKNTYLYFHNKDTGFGCLYNVNNQKRDYLDYEKVDIINGKILEYQDNRLNFKYDDKTYYFNDITESNNLKMHENGDYLFTIDSSNNMLKIYNLETNKIIYSRLLPELNNSTIEDILIDDYAYFTIIKDNRTKLYIWDYLKETRSNKNMISLNEKEYKFKNNEIKEEIKSKYNIDIYIYDQAVVYFTDAYVIASYDDILINSRLTVLRDILNEMDEKERIKLQNVRICLEKSIIDDSTSDNLDVIKIHKDNLDYMAIDITNDNFKSVFMDVMTNYGDFIDFLE